eukprot:4989616-Prymnesium_polylepis.2
MRVQKVYTYHWDKDFPLVVYYAKRDIQPGEELTYRRDSSDRKSVIAGWRVTYQAIEAQLARRRACHATFERTALSPWYHRRLRRSADRIRGTVLQSNRCASGHAMWMAMCRRAAMDVFDVKCLVWGKKLVSSSVVRCATCPSSPHRIFTFTHVDASTWHH